VLVCYHSRQSALYHSKSLSDYDDNITYDTETSSVTWSTTVSLSMVLTMSISVRLSAAITLSGRVTVVSEPEGEVTDCRWPCVGDELSIKHRATSSSSQAPESHDILRRRPDESGVAVSRIVSIWTSGVVGALHVNDAALDGVAFVSQAASCSDSSGARDVGLSLSACDRQS